MYSLGRQSASLETRHAEYTRRRTTREGRLDRSTAGELLFE
jgi:hypothetical protein